jgi:hypothetical protein
MRITYLKVIFKLSFDKKTVFRNLPTVVIRGALGRELRRMSCIFRGKDCKDCSIKKTCAYSFLFETHIDKDNSAVYGRNRGSHPFVLYTEDISGKPISSMDLELTLIGKACDYFPYFYHALQKAGESGFSTDSIRFNISNVIHEGQPLLDKNGGLKTDIIKSEWSLDNKSETRKYDYYIDIKTPLRIKKDGKYLSNITYPDIIRSIDRRVRILHNMYMEESKLEITEKDMDIDKFITIKSYSQKISWKELRYYSKRQESPLKFGGVVGIMQVSGNFSTQECSLLDACRIFNVGKNISFGLGRVEIAND